MLSELERKYIEDECNRYERRSAGCIEALKVVQKQRGWISDEAVREIAEFLGMSAEEVDGVATFYNLIFREPVGEHVLFVCDSVSCWIKGCDRIRDRVREQLGIDYGQTSVDGLLTMLPIACLGTCEHAPAVLLDEETVHDVSDEKLDRMIAKISEEFEQGKRRPA